MLNCKNCGYKVSPKSKCIWCDTDRDFLNAFNLQEIDHMHLRFKAMRRQMKTNYIIAMGLEGFNPEEIGVITNWPVQCIEDILAGAEVYIP